MAEKNLPEVVDEEKNIPEKMDQVKQSVSRVADFSEQIEKLMPLIGTIKLSEEEKEILYAPVNEGLIEVRPDGLIFLPWTFYITRMRQAFGLEWAIIPIGFPRIKGENMIWPFWLIIRGIPVSLVIGEQRMANSQMSWSDQAEGTKSNALMRACKAIGVCLQLWQPEFIRNWKTKYAVQGKDGKWSKKMTAQQAVDEVKEMFPGAVHQAEDAPVTPESPPEMKSSALLFTQWHDEMVRLNHLQVLRSWWEKVKPEAELKLHPEHFKQLDLEKTRMRAYFLEKATKENAKK